MNGEEKKLIAKALGLDILELPGERRWRVQKWLQLGGVLLGSAVLILMALYLLAGAPG